MPFLKDLGARLTLGAKPLNSQPFITEEFELVSFYPKGSKTIVKLL